jgi:hypothetical protein
MASRRPRPSDPAGRASVRSGPHRICDVEEAPASFRHLQGARQPRHGLLFLYRKLGCTISNEPLGTDYTVACGEDGEGGRAGALNAQFDEWNTKRKGGHVSTGRLAAYGTVDWLFREYKQSKAYLEKVAPRSRPDYERTILLIADIVTKKGRPGRRSTDKGDHAG